jgi:hypothetical protein
MTALDKKEALLVQLRNMNEEAAAGMHTDGEAGSSDYTPGFQRAYAAVLMQACCRGCCTQHSLHLSMGWQQTRVLCWLCSTQLWHGTSHDENDLPPCSSRQSMRPWKASCSGCSSPRHRHRQQRH